MDEKCQFLSLHASYLPIQVLKTSLHGGLIRRMCGIIFTEMNCDLPTGISEMPDFKAARPLNTSFSRFKVDICTENHVIKTMKCETLFNSDHLNALA